MTSSAAMKILFLHVRIYRSLGIIFLRCNFCLNPHITYGDMKENVCGCFFLNTV